MNLVYSDASRPHQVLPATSVSALRRVFLDRSPLSARRPGSALSLGLVFCRFFELSLIHLPAGGSLPPSPLGWLDSLSFSSLSIFCKGPVSGFPVPACCSPPSPSPVFTGMFFPGFSVAQDTVVGFPHPSLCLSCTGVVVFIVNWARLSFLL